MGEVLKGLIPGRVFYYFEEICQIPHESGNTQALTAFIIEFAKNHELKFYTDDIGNVVIYKNAYPGYEDHKSVILQGHIDMVCEKNYDLEGRFDFAKDPLNLVVMEDYVFAKGTSLGADDGIAVAYMLAILETDNVKAPAIEAVFTVDEENGMKGALELDCSVLNSKQMINLDHEVEGEILTCSAGGRRVRCSFPVETVELSGVRYDIVLCGLAGGHSGMEIDKGRGNANLLMGRLLHTITKNFNFHLVNLVGGLTDSAIPREAKAEILIDEENVDALEDIISNFSDIIQNEYDGIEDNITLYGQNMGYVTKNVLTRQSKKRIGFLLNTIPDGIIRMSRYGEDIVQTSLNSGIMKLTENEFILIVNMRSLVASEKEALSDKVQYLVEAIGGTYTIETDYPGWEYSEESELREIAFEAYQRTFSRNPRMLGFHAGLECGAFFEKIKGLDIIAIGPDIIGIHTPKENLSVLSTERVYDYLLNLLEML